jgi:hypothetical protein
MPAQRGAAFLHVSLSAFTFGFENALLMFSYVLVFGELGNGSVSFDNLMLYSLSVCDLAGAFSIAI